PRLKIDWRYLSADVETVRRAMALLANDLQSSGVGTLDYDASALEAEITRYGAYGGHHIGTTRMGDNPLSSVVDPDCRVHDVDNLFIASSS
ncbi:GMC oxidoreductase, partial [Acinetobacter baumannii]